MIYMDAWTSIRFLHSKGKSLRWIAKELGISRNTVRKAIRDKNIPEYSRKLCHEIALEKHKEEIERMVFKDNLSFAEILFSGTTKEGDEKGM
ncbi:hypothetical protein AUJ95_04220 [Candidatus Desantisbacteria bacterium CG2_30_40_21]|uniref:Transposase IS30-like HTH domain-containing protein n=5 Tax=unclassified Candidatus Desantisiibacteriota TaxID=3106372 RepID=A0A2M7JDU8_9BACT|nr:MAG: hypothetical protein AUJ95_04220 [Candidatus Desantisbacteria bacterium CG2_30_40_21]PIP40933.1 MAG: hypothetical protein COX18_05125 [Candidatus Desantisbacteria bacterium CG23_combo_of_CG06-09_8_20_14_all_40_23]PIX17578.1 MAG: hypothetical protein COZ71_02525 [Candidatus Desantisbacteria bacterium CG_4_8_14_3_um_filter_40_12]PIY19011.1 MAG: hypothetical protein COZ13_07590 [Candidatus Desantisbacteria bacterium CG_4_10_14_3_um_filter_40_18]PJB27905.1 MAG: hypothetical protein CO110_10